MKRTAAYTLAVATLGLVIWSGVTTLRQTFSPNAWLRNPLGLSTAVGATGPVVLDSVQSLQRLETCRYNGQVIVRGDTGGALPVWLAGDRILFVGRGEVVAGIDLRALRPEDIRVDGKKIAVRLPEPQILHSRLDNQQSQVHERRTGFFTGPDITLETQVRQEAEERIRSAALESGVLTTARDNARSVLRDHLATLGFQQVQFL